MGKNNIWLSSITSFEMRNAQTGEVVFSGYIEGEENNMEQKLNEFLTKNNIQVDDNGNFEAYIVVDADDKENVPGTIFNGVDVEAYSLDGAYEDLKECENTTSFYNDYINIATKWFGFTKKIIKLEKQISIREKLLFIEDKILKVLINKNNITNVFSDKLIINKYKVLEEIQLNPQFAYKIVNFTNDGEAEILLYNTLTLKSEIIKFYYDGYDGSDDCCYSKEYMDKQVKYYLDTNELQVKLMNDTMGSIIE
jgi:hypothetical protein